MCLLNHLANGLVDVCRAARSPLLLSTYYGNPAGQIKTATRLLVIWGYYAVLLRRPHADLLTPKDGLCFTQGRPRGIWMCHLVTTERLPSRENVLVSLWAIHLLENGQPLQQQLQVHWVSHLL